MDGVSLRLHQPVPKEVALRFDRPWEGTSSIFIRVMKDGDVYRNWYRAGADRDQAAAYAESADGIHWERKILGMVEYDGSIDNNIILRDDGITNLAVFRDDNPAVPENERYKAIAKGPKIDGRATIRGLSSPDGFQWKVIDVDPILVAPDDGWPMFDSTNVAFWDDAQGQYVAYMRGWFPSEGRVSSSHHGGVRSIRRSVSPDFRTWSPPEFIDMGDSQPEHLYTNAATSYFRAPHIYLMFPRRFVVGRKLRDDWAEDGLSDAVFMSSRDGIHWDRRFMEPLIPTGRDIDDWTDRSMTPGVGLVPTGPDEMSIYYKEHNRLPTVRMRRGVFRTDGIVSLYSTYSGGEFVTHPLNLRRRRTRAQLRHVGGRECASRDAGHTWRCGPRTLTGRLRRDIWRRHRACRQVARRRGRGRSGRASRPAESNECQLRRLLLGALPSERPESAPTVRRL